MWITENILLWKHFKQSKFHRRQGSWLTHHSNVTFWPKLSCMCITKDPWHLSFSEINKKILKKKKPQCCWNRNMENYIFTFQQIFLNPQTIYFNFDLVLKSRKLVIRMYQIWLSLSLSYPVSNITTALIYVYRTNPEKAKSALMLQIKVCTKGEHTFLVKCMKNLQ
jgi:hypothetical protein